MYCIADFLAITIVYLYNRLPLESFIKPEITSPAEYHTKFITNLLLMRSSVIPIKF